MSEKYTSSYISAKINVTVYEIVELLKTKKQVQGLVLVLNTLSEKDNVLWGNFLQDLSNKGLHFENKGKPNNEAIVDRFLLNPSNPEYFQHTNKQQVIQYLEEHYPLASTEKIDAFYNIILKYETYSN